MKHLVSILYFTILTTALFSQGGIVFNNNGYVVIENSAFVVLDNPSSAALSASAGTGNILSEDETDVIKWNISSNTGTYTIPWVTNSGTKIPQVMNITGAGSVGGSILFSTYETATDLNVPYPSGVTNMNYNAVDYSLYAADRFWHIDARSYGTMPTGNMILGYDPAANEIGGTNTITETNLQAQRFDTGLGHWDANTVLGTNDAGNDRVTGIPFSAADFYQDWILVDNTNPLPVTLISFSAACENDHVTITWTTETEINNDYFVLEKSNNGFTFFEIETIQGNGNSNVNINYEAKDYTSTNGTAYYRLKQVDFDGKTSYHDLIATSCSSGEFNVSNLLLNTSELDFNITLSDNEKLQVLLYDSRGKLITSSTLNATDGITKINLKGFNISQGIYMLSIVGENNIYSTKLFRR